MSIEKARAHLEARGLGDRIMEFDQSCATVELAAEVVGCKPNRIAKTLSFHVGDRVALVLFAGDARVDNRKFKERFHTKARMLGADEAEALIGHAVGGVCPFGVNEGCDIYLDESLKRFAVLYPAAGTSASVARMTINELEQACAPCEWVDVSKLPEYEGEITGRTHLVCLVGNPTGHSLSPAIHNLSFELLGLDSVYVCFDVENSGLKGIIEAFKAMKRWDGLNVTMPCKQAVMEHLDALDDAAELVGAVNVVSKTADGHAIGHNTDGVGFMTSLSESGVQAKGARMVLLGPGGAGSAILVQAALDGVARIDVFARASGVSYEKAQALAERVMAKTNCVIQLHDMACIDGLASCINEADILVNATPVGMGEKCTDTPVPADLLKPGLVVADAIYHPRQTQLIRDAQERGCTTVSGLGMLLAQAAAGEAIWYDVDMPVQEIAARLF